MGEGTDPAALAKDLNRALALVARDAISASLAAGAITGPEGIALAEHLTRLAAEEVRDVERLAARIGALKATPQASVAALTPPREWRDAVGWLVEMQRDAADAVVAAIPADADDTEGEATEHLLEHIVSRKRDAIELLERALR